MLSMPRLVILPGLDGTNHTHGEFRHALSIQGVESQFITYPTMECMGYEALENLVGQQLPNEPFFLLGESFSTPLAIKMAANPPKHLQGLVLSTPFTHSPVPASRLLASFIPLLPQTPPLRLLSHVLLGRWRTAELESQLHTAVDAVKPEVLKFRAQQAAKVDVSALLGHIAIPALCLVAMRDALISPKAQQKVSHAMPSSQLACVEAPHFLLQAKASEAANHIACFMAGCATHQ